MILLNQTRCYTMTSSINLTSPKLPTNGAEPVAKQSPICTLSTDILQKIIQFLGPVKNPKDIDALRITCQAMNQITLIPHEHSEEEYSISIMKQKHQITKHADILGACQTLGIEETGIVQLLRSAVRKGIPWKQITLDPDAGVHDYMRLSSSHFGMKQNQKPIVVSLETQTQRPVVGIAGHQAYTLTEEPSKRKSYLKLSQTNCVITLFQRQPNNKELWTLTDSTENFIEGIPWYYNVPWYEPLPEDDSRNFLSSSGAFRIGKIQHIVANTHEGIHLGIPEISKIREIVQLVMFDSIYTGTTEITNLKMLLHKPSKIIAEYASDSQGCRRCEVQEVMSLGKTVRKDQEQLSKRIQNERLRGVLKIHRLIEGYEGRS
jgi:hypothetical protein